MLLVPGVMERLRNSRGSEDSSSVCVCLLRWSIRGWGWMNECCAAIVPSAPDLLISAGNIEGGGGTTTPILSCSPIFSPKIFNQSLSEVLTSLASLWITCLQLALSDSERSCEMFPNHKSLQKFTGTVGRPPKGLVCCWPLTNARQQIYV